MSSLYNKIGESTYDQLLADPQGADVIAISCTPGKGIVKRGTVMFRETTGMYSPAAAANVVSTNMLAVINETVDTGAAPEGGAVTTAEDAAAYRAGRFIDGRVTLAEDAALTAEHKVILRLQNIVFNQKDTAQEFNNSVS